MSQVETVAVYPEEGFAVLEDNSGKFLMFEKTDEIVDLGDAVFQNLVRTMMNRSEAAVVVA